MMALIYPKYLDAGNFTWSVFQVLLVWVIDTINMTMLLPPHIESCFNEVCIPLYPPIK